MSIKKDKYFISLANNLAKNALGYTGPNPPVGALVVKDNKILSFATTSSSGRPHAEINALKKLSLRSKRNATIYISLEPCVHFGKSPPCVNEIIKSKFKKVVYSIQDVDLRTSGKSFKILKSNKIVVKKDLLSNSSKLIYKNYFYSKKKNIPYVIGKLAISKDYYLKEKNNFYITNKQSLKTAHILRSRINCILISSKTINDDNPKLNCRIPGLETFSPKVAILDKNLKINTNSFLLNNAKKTKTFLFYNKINKNKLKYLKSKKVTSIYTPIINKKLDIKYILKKLYKFEVSSILIEGGKILTTSLINQGFCNEFYLFISSKSLKNKGILKIKNIKSILSRKFLNKKNKVSFLENDNLIHYY